MRLGDNEIAEIFINEMWVPICGHYFWDNNHGAELFCQKLGYKSGQPGAKSPLPSDGVKIGKCYYGDIWPNCSGGCNDHSIGGNELCDCRSGAMSGTKINCVGN